MPRINVRNDISRLYSPFQHSSDGLNILYIYVTSILQSEQREESVIRHVVWAFAIPLQKERISTCNWFTWQRWHFCTFVYYISLLHYTFLLSKRVYTIINLRVITVSIEILLTMFPTILAYPYYHWKLSRKVYTLSMVNAIF